MNVKADQQSRVLPCDTQARGQGWDLDAIDRVIDDLKRQPRTGVIKVLISVQRAEEAKRSLNEEDLNNRNILTEDYSPRTVFELASGQFGATHPQIPPGIPTIVTEYAANYEPPIPVRQAATEPAILAHCPVAPAEPNALSFYTLNPTLRSMMFDGPQETYYEQDPRFDGLGICDSGSGANSKSSDSGEGG